MCWRSGSRYRTARPILLQTPAHAGPASGQHRHTRIVQPGRPGQPPAPRPPLRGECNRQPGGYHKAAITALPHLLNSQIYPNPRSTQLPDLPISQIPQRLERLAAPGNEQASSSYSRPRRWTSVSVPAGERSITWGRRILVSTSSPWPTREWEGRCVGPHLRSRYMACAAGSI